MRKIINIFCFLICSTLSLLCQDLYNGTKTVPELTTPNPDTYSLGRYGEVPMNLYNGTANIVVPLQTLNFEGLEFPINITYNTSTYRVDQEASWVGLGWTLSCEPIITRQIKGNSDIDQSGIMTGGPFRGYIYTDVSLPEYGGEVSDDLVEALELYSYRHAASFGWDTEPDIFTANIFGESVSFVFIQKKFNDDKIGIKLINGDKRYQILYEEKNQTFTIINDQGFKFYFTNKEYSIVAGRQESEQYFAKESSPEYITGWKLSKIESPNNNELTFSYSSVVSQSIPKYSNSKYAGNTAIEGGLLPVPMYNDQFNRSSFMLGYQSYSLNQISCNNFTVNFQSSGRLDLAALGVDTYEITNIGTIIGFSDTPPQKLDDIIIKDNKNNIIKSYSLKYSYFNNDQINKKSKAELKRLLRLKLDQIDLDNTLYRKFSYIKPDGLSSKFYRYDDFWGYYNGDMGHSIKLYPSFKIPLRIGTKIVDFSIEGDNRFPNFNYAKAGLLEKVIYPTGGYTLLNYEPHDIKINKDNVEEYRSLGFKSEKEIVIESQSSDYPVESEIIEILEDSPIDTTVEIWFGINGNYNITQKEHHIKYDVEEKDKDSISFQLIDIKNNKVIHKASFKSLECTGCPPIAYTVYEGWNKKTLSLKIPKGKYKARVKALKHISNFFDENDGASSNHPDYGKQYNFMVKAILKIPLFAFYKQYNMEVGGGRIKSIDNYNKGGSLLFKKEYKYILDKSIGDNISSGDLTKKLLFYDFKAISYSIGPDYDHLSPTRAETLTVYSDNLTESGSTSHIGYSRVEEHSIDNNNLSNNGSVVSEFINAPDQHPKLVSGGNFLSFLSTGITAREESLASIPSRSYFDINGKIKQETYYNNNGQKIKESKYSYNYESTGNDNISHTNKIATGIKQYIRYNYEYPMGGYPQVSASTGIYIMQIYKIISENILPISKIETNYINGETLTQTTTYNYNNDYQPLLVQTSSSRSNINQETYYKYPSDFKTVSPYKDMVKKNILSPIIEKQEKQNNKESIVRTNYETFNNLYLPTSTQTSLDGVNNLRTDITYNRYDFFGNLIQCTTKEGLSTIYLWSHSGQYPIAEIKNATYNEVNNIININNLSNKLLPEDNDYKAIRALETGLKDALITTYTYKPLIGMTSMTDPRGVTTTYEYDAFGRLSKVKDTNGKVINSYDYHYQNQ